MLRQLRVDGDFTQRALADKLRKPYSYVHKVEHAQRRIDPIELVAWCKACGADPRDILAAFI